MSLVELELELETPLFMGGHDPLKLDETWFLRPSAVKGIWRWWARALVAGALYDSGKLKGFSRQGILKAPDPEKEAAKISEIVGRKLGLGYASPKGESEASNYSIVVEPSNDVKKFRKSLGAVEGRRCKLKRISLLMLGRRKREEPLEYLDPGARFRLKVEGRKKLPSLEPKAVDVALSALSLALTLSGLGKGSRRGLGCFRVVDFKAPSEYDYAQLFDPKISAAEKIEHAVDGVRDLLKVEGIEGSASELPPLPSISARKLLIGRSLNGRALYPFQVLEVRGRDSRRLLEHLHNFFVRGERARILEDYKGEDELRRGLNAWILGLPREGKVPREKKRKEGEGERERREEEEKTGYLIKIEGAERRASPLILAVHEGADTAAVAYLSAFISADWPSKLEWRAIEPKPIDINERRVVEAMACALKEYVEYVKKCKLGVSFIWPR
jgi:CRISPR-associated protein Cmr1